MSFLLYPRPDLGQLHGLAGPRRHSPAQFRDLGDSVGLRVCRLGSDPLGCRPNPQKATCHAQSPLLGPSLSDGFLPGTPPSEEEDDPEGTGGERHEGPGPCWSAAGLWPNPLLVSSEPAPHPRQVPVRPQHCVQLVESQLILLLFF